MKTKILLTGFVIPVLVAMLGWSARAAFASPACDPGYVTQAGNVFTVTPTNVDDTANTQCAFDAAVAAGAESEVHLSAGMFHTAQIVVNNFQGKFTGAGMNKTRVANLPDLYVTPVDMYLNPPSADNPWPSLFAFVNGNFSVSDLAIHISGDNGTTGWTIFGIDPPITELAHGIVILGTEANVRVDRILIEGELMENSLYGYNLINGVFYEGFIGDFPLVPISGSFQVYDSTFRRVASGTPSFNLSNASVIINRNRFENVFDAIDSADLVNSSFVVTQNYMKDAYIGVWLYTNFVENSGSQFLIKNNIFTGYNNVFGGSYGPLFDGFFGEANNCLLQGNNTQNVIDFGILLGEWTHGCMVVGGSTKTTVLDLGTDNILVGVNNMGTGVGPEIRTLLKIVK